MLLFSFFLLSYITYSLIMYAQGLDEDEPEEPEDD